MSGSVREYERALSGVQQEVSAYQSVLAQTQSQYSSLEDKYNKAKQMIRGMQEREREVLMKVRHREAGFHTLLQALQHRMQLLELHLVDAQRAAGLPVSIPPPPANLPALAGGLLSVGFADSVHLAGEDLADLSGSTDPSVMSSELKEELDKAIPPHEPLDTSAARARADLASRGGMALRQSPSQGLLRRSGNGALGTSMSSTSSLEHSFIEESTRLDEISATESAGNRSQESFHEVYLTSSRSTTTYSSGRSQQQQQQPVYSSSQYYQQQQQQQQHYHQHHSSSTGQQAAVKAAAEELQQQAGGLYYHPAHDHHHHHQHFAGPPQATRHPQPAPQQHVNDQLKQLMAERQNNLQADPLAGRLQPTTSSNRSMGGRPPAPEPRPPALPPHQSNVFYPADVPVESRLRKSIRSGDGEGFQRSGSSHNMPTSVTSSAASISSSSNAVSASAGQFLGSLFSQPISDWNVETVGNWLRSISNCGIIKDG